MKEVANQTQGLEQPSGIFGLRYLEEEELTLADVSGCQSAVSIAAPPTVGVVAPPAQGSFSIRLCGDGGDTD
ncbi:MAG TPA: herpeto-tandem family RiPP [Roseiflexaceae bacterium]|nr:herpeto-tandem family RiPP [Roseiflexaceae bacterium]